MSVLQSTWGEYFKKSKKKNYNNFFEVLSIFEFFKKLSSSQDHKGVASQKCISQNGTKREQPPPRNGHPAPLNLLLNYATNVYAYAFLHLTECIFPEGASSYVGGVVPDKARSRNKFLVVLSNVHQAFVNLQSGLKIKKKLKVFVRIISKNMYFPIW